MTSSSSYPGSSAAGFADSETSDSDSETESAAASVTIALASVAAEPVRPTAAVDSDSTSAADLNY